MRTLSAVIVLGAVLVTPAVSPAAVVCPDRAPAAITSPPEGSVKCQQTIAKSGTNFFKKKMKTIGKCLGEQTPGLCPRTDDTDKVSGEYAKALQKITDKCGDDAAQGGLTSSYGDLADPAPIASCMLSQHNASADILLGVINGTPGEFRPEDERADCVQTLNKEGIKYATAILGAWNKCLGKRMKDGVGGDLAPICVGSWASGSFVPPTDTTTAEKLATFQGKLEDKVDDKCTPAQTLDFIKSIFACPGAQTVADLQQCIVCESWNTGVDLLAQENDETGTYVANGPGALQDAIDAAGPGSRLLLASGDYVEEVSLAAAQCNGGANDDAPCGSDSECPGGTCASEHDGLQIVGCGGATNDRPRVVRPAGPPNTHPNGISATATDNLLFQSLDLFDWDSNGIFIVNANGVRFRDVFADGNDNSEYGIFPVQSNDVVVEGCRVVGVEDAGIYVGQSTNILVRYSSAEQNVAGIEIENSANATVHNNYAAGNTGGILVFKLPGLPVQLSNNHEVFDNVVLNNNSVNTGSGTVGAVPDGTGMLVLSNDDGEFHHNIIHGNGSFGFALVDQTIIDVLGGGVVFGGVYSPDQKAEGNFIHDNAVSGNAGAPDSTPPNATPLSANILFVLAEDTNHNNCFQAPNGTAPTLLTPNDCTP